MGIYIKGMEMPVIDLEWTIRHGADGKWYAIDTNAETSDGEWHEIIPVPPHGRLGDLNALAQQIEYERFHHAHTDSLAGQHHVAEYGHFLKTIFDAPTIIPASEEDDK